MDKLWCLWTNYGLTLLEWPELDLGEGPNGKAYKKTSPSGESLETS